jgi:hypothetical protein
VKARYVGRLARLRRRHVPAARRSCCRCAGPRAATPRHKQGRQRHGGKRYGPPPAHREPAIPPPPVFTPPLGSRAAIVGPIAPDSTMAKSNMCWYPSYVTPYEAL